MILSMSATYTCSKGHQYVAPTARLGDQAGCPVCAAPMTSIAHLPNIDPCPDDENTPGGRCNDCGRMVAYDLDTDTYVHTDEPEAQCFLVAARTDLAEKAR